MSNCNQNPAYVNNWLKYGGAPCHNEQPDCIKGCWDKNPYTNSDATCEWLNENCITKSGGRCPLMTHTLQTQCNSYDDDKCTNNTIVHLPDGTSPDYSSNGSVKTCILSPPSWDCDSKTCTDPGTGKGQYTSLTTCETDCGITPSWDCVSNTCTDPGTGKGQYTSLTACQTDCGITPSWDCDSVSNTCTDPGTGKGQYASKTACKTACRPSWDCVSNTCTDPGTGKGQYASKTACKTACRPSWDCDYDSKTCTDPGTGKGQYTSLTTCENACGIKPSWDCDSNNDTCTDPGTGKGQYTSLTACQSYCCGKGYSYLSPDGCVPNGTPSQWSTESVSEFCKKANLKEQCLCDWTKQWSCPDPDTTPTGTQGSATNDGSMSFRCCCPKACDKVNCTTYLDGKLCPLHPTDDNEAIYAYDDGSNEFNCCCPKVSLFPPFDNSLCNDIVKTSTNITCGAICGSLDVAECNKPSVGCKAFCVIQPWRFNDCVSDCDNVKNRCIARNLQGCYQNCIKDASTDLNNACNSMKASCDKSATELIPPENPVQMCKDMLIAMTASMTASGVAGAELDMAIDILETIFSWVCAPFASLVWSEAGYSTAIGKSVCADLFGTNNMSVKDKKVYYNNTEINKKNYGKIKCMVKTNVESLLSSPSPPSPSPSQFNIGTYIIPLIVVILSGIVFMIIKYNR